MKKLLPHYERELVALRTLGKAFAAQYPAAAGRLGMPNGVAEDPQAERVVQASAFLNARIAQRLDDQFPQFTEALLNVHFPLYLRPFPSTSVVQFDAGGAATSARVIPRGTMLRSAEVNGVICRFMTASDVALAPIAIAEASFQPLFNAPPVAMRSPDVGAAISISFERKAAVPLGASRLRVFLDGDAGFCGLLRDVLFLQSRCAYLQADGEWTHLALAPLHCCDDALMPAHATSHAAHRLVTEYFACPEKSNFIEFDWDAITAVVGPEVQRFTLHIGLAPLGADSAAARVLPQLNTRHFQLGCAAVVNLFRQSACPFEFTQEAAEYGVVADATRAHAFEVYSIDAVRMVARSGVTSEVPALYSHRHGSHGAQSQYWSSRRDEVLATVSPGHECRIAFTEIDIDADPREPSTVSIEISCTNRALPAQLRYGAPQGDLRQEGGNAPGAIRLLRKPSLPLRFKADAHWRLVSLLSLNHASLLDGDTLAELLALHDVARSPTSLRQIAAIRSTSQQPARAWLHGPFGAAMVHGLEARVQVDEDAFAGGGLHAFASMLELVLGLHAQINSFTQLVILAGDKELMRCPPRNGTQALA